VLILASASQSRKKLLENCQIEFIQISSNFDETSIKEKIEFKSLPNFLALLSSIEILDNLDMCFTVLRSIVI